VNKFEDLYNMESHRTRLVEQLGDRRTDLEFAKARLSQAEADLLTHDVQTVKLLDRHNASFYDIPGGQYLFVSRDIAGRVLDIHRGDVNKAVDSADVKIPPGFFDPKPADPKPSGNEPAEYYLREALKDGPVKIEELKSDSHSRGFFWESINLAAEKLGVTYDGHCHSWKLPTPAPDTFTVSLDLPLDDDKEVA
jgi:hypothetical protein